MRNRANRRDALGCLSTNATAGTLLMWLLKHLLVCVGLTSPLLASADTIRVAAAADLKFAMDEVVAAFKAGRPGDQVELVYGSSGNFFAQIQQGAPFDLFFSADIGFPRELAKAGLTASEVRPYATGRLVLWSATMDASKMTLASLTDPRIARIAIANPKHAPYGKRAEEALKAAGVWNQVQAKLVFGENIAHTAQFVQTGSAQVGFLALALALNKELASKGGYWLVPDNLHSPLEQGYVVTKQGASKPLAARFAEYMASKPARALLVKYGFVLPGEATSAGEGSR